MSRGVCLTVGLNVVDTASPAYAGVRVPVLAGCVNDATAVADLVAGLDGFDAADVRTLADGQATCAAVLGALGGVARVLEPGDLFVLHYSGHGMKGSYDADGRADPDARATSWILHDAPLGHDRVFAAWAGFPRGVRVLVLSDSCHSGAATRGLGGGRPRGLDWDARRRVLANLGPAAARGDEGPAAPEAAVLLISGCQVDETSLDATDGAGVAHGLFTATVLDVFGAGSFAGDYHAFHRAVAARTEARGRQLDPAHPQNPNLFLTGRPVDAAVFAGSAPPFRV